jgi:hypothetical protein
MLSQAYRDVLIETATNALSPAAAQLFVEAVRLGAWNRLVAMNSPPQIAMATIVNAAAKEGWLRDFVQRLVVDPVTRNRPEFAAVLAEIDKGAALKTSPDPFEEVLVEGGRPFVNRQPLRARLLVLTDPLGSTVLVVDGAPQSGKSYSYYLINHVAQAKGYTVHRFKLASLPHKPDELAAEILTRIGATVGTGPNEVKLDPIGNESAERWAWKLAATVARVIKEMDERRLLVFDEFPTATLPDGSIVEAPLPAGTASFLIRLGTYADEELRKFLRIVLIRFREPFPQELDDVLLRDDAKPFTSTDMVAVVMQIAKARGWSLAADKVQTRIETYDVPGRSLNEKFKFLRGLLQELEAAK